MEKLIAIILKKAYEIKDNNNITKTDYYDAVWFLWIDEW